MSDEQNPWKVDVWKDCEKCKGTGRVPYEKKQYADMSIDEKAFRGQYDKCDGCPADPDHSDRGTGKIRKSFTLKELFAEMKKAP
jgi:hypothetical protein